jgi:enoyl-CoA hydratase/carnithine racemase
VLDPHRPEVIPRPSGSDLPTYRTLLATVDRGVAAITLSRPRQRNAVGDGMREELADAYLRCDRADAVRVIVVTGAPPAFCAGADLAAGERTFTEPGPKFSAAGIDVPAWTLSKPVIAAVNGHAIGLGLTLALQCDIRYFAADARYGVVQVRVLDADDVLPAALELAHDIAENAAPAAVAASKRLLWDSFDLDRAAVGARETEIHLALMGHDDAREGVRALQQRRAPNWSGRPADPTSEGARLGHLDA